MGIFSWIGKLFKRIFNAIMKFLKKFWWLIVIVLVILAIFFPPALAAIGAWLSSIPGALLGAVKAAAGWVVSLFQGLTLGESLALGAGLAFLVAPKETAEAIGGIIESTGSAVGDVVGGAASGLFSSTGGVLLLGALGVGLLLWMSDDDGDQPSEMDYAAQEAEMQSLWDQKLAAVRSGDSGDVV